MIERDLDKLQRMMGEKSTFFEARREKAREEILSFVIMHPAPSMPAVKKQFPYGSIVDFFSASRFVTAPLAAVLVFAGAISVAAHNTIPGDTLYAVKTNVNEEVRGWFVLSSVGEAKFQAELAEERVREIERLALSGKAEPEAIRKLEEKFKEHAGAVETKLSELESEEAHEEILDVSTRFESSLKAHEEVLEGIEVVGDEVEEVLSSVEEEIDKTQEAKDSAGEKIETDRIIEEESAYRALEAAKEEIRQAEKLVDELSPSLSKKAKKEAESRLKRAQRAYLEGREDYSDEEYAEGFIEFSLARSHAEEARIYLELQKELEGLLEPEASPSPEESPNPEASPSESPSPSPAGRENPSTSEEKSPSPSPSSSVKPQESPKVSPKIQ